jgi:hypothetical protein
VCEVHMAGWRGVSSRALVIASRIPGSFLSLSRRTIISSVYPVRGDAPGSRQGEKRARAHSTVAHTVAPTVQC